jgi:hypothetical protein
LNIGLQMPSVSISKTKSHFAFQSFDEGTNITLIPRVQAPSEVCISQPYREFSRVDLPHD